MAAERTPSSARFWPAAAGRSQFLISQHLRAALLLEVATREEVRPNFGYPPRADVTKAALHFI